MIKSLPSNSAGYVMRFISPMSSSPDISVEIDNVYGVETVNLSHMSTFFCVGYRIRRNKIASLWHSPWKGKLKDRLAVYAILDEKSFKAYIGETEDLLKRLNDHCKKEPVKDWSVALAFCDADGTFLDKGKIKFLEHFAWDAATSAGTYHVTNSTAPKASHVTNKKDTYAFGDYMKALTLPLGVPYLFSPISGTTCSSVSSTPASIPPSIPTTPFPSPSSPSPPPSAKGVSAGDYSPAAVFAAALSLLGPTLSKKEVSWLQTDVAKKALLLGRKGLPPLKLHSGFDADFMSSGHARYFNPSKFVFSYSGTIYRVSKEGFKRKNGTIPTYEWAIKHGLSDAQICSECKKLGFKPC